MKKIFACIKVQNDADIIESFCRYYCSFCDGILVTDDMSSDNTPDILKKLVDEGLPVFVTDQNVIDLGLGGLNVRMKQFHLAIEHYNADLILPIDVDEFLINKNGGNPRVVLESIDENIEYHIMRRNYICPSKLDNIEFFPKMTNKYVDLLSPKTVMSRFLLKERNAVPLAGCHSFMYTTESPAVIDLDDLYYNHYPIRSEYQFMLKIILGWIHYLTLPFHDGDRRYNQAWHWKAFYNEIKKHGIVSQEMLEIYSAYNSTSIPDYNNYDIHEKLFDISFCHDKLKLRYTDYASNKIYFLQILAAQMEKNILRMPSWRSSRERQIAGEQLGQANATIHNLNAYIEKLQKQRPFSEKYGSIFFNTGKDFNEKEKIVFLHNQEKIQLFQEIILPQNTISVRFDPVEGCGCFLQNLVIQTDTGDALNYQILNGYNSENNGIVFTSNDPQIQIDIVDNNINKLSLQCDFWFLN